MNDKNPRTTILIAVMAVCFVLAAVVAGLVVVKKVLPGLQKTAETDAAQTEETVPSIVVGSGNKESGGGKNKPSGNTGVTETPAGDSGSTKAPAGDSGSTKSLFGGAGNTTQQLRELETGDDGLSGHYTLCRYVDAEYSLPEVTLKDLGVSGTLTLFADGTGEMRMSGSPSNSWDVSFTWDEETGAVKYDDGLEGYLSVSDGLVIIKEDELEMTFRKDGSDSAKEKDAEPDQEIKPSDASQPPEEDATEDNSYVGKWKSTDERIELLITDIGEFYMYIDGEWDSQGIVQLRKDGKELELYSLGTRYKEWGSRMIFDVTGSVTDTALEVRWEPEWWFKDDDEDGEGGHEYFIGSRLVRDR